MSSVDHATELARAERRWLAEARDRLRRTTTAPIQRDDHPEDDR